MPRNPYLCLSIVLGLVAVAVIGAGGIILTASLRVEEPASLNTIVGTAVGALASFLVMVPRGSAGGGDQTFLVVPQQKADAPK